MTRQEMLGEPFLFWSRLLPVLQRRKRPGRGHRSDTKPDPQPDSGEMAEFVQRSPGSLTCLNTFYCCWKSSSFQANLYQH